ncbi:MAG TPA: HAMP domain-containing sensor histidine kinase [Longimicrobiales bacterium]|nr:HAMP domain-containing sensor histidine kinase [Longimicrobiales bacterium]
MSWIRQSGLRAKVLITLIGAGVALLGVSTHLSFRYWKSEVVAAAEQQALLSALAARAAVEAALQAGAPDQGRRALRRLTTYAPVVGARLFDAKGAVMLAPLPGEEGRQHPRVWLPSVREIPRDGVARTDVERGIVHAFVPVAIPPAAVLEIEYSLGPVKAAMDRGGRIGLGLVIGSVFALVAILFTMLEREVVAPLSRVANLVPGAAASGGVNELSRLEAGVTQLLRQEQRAEDAAAEQRRMLEAQAGFAQVGEMAAEMAHEFKRPLTSIQSAVQLLSQEYVLEERGQRLLGAVEDQLAHLSETMRDLFMLAKPVDLQTAHVMLSAVVDGSLAQLAGHPAAAGIDVRREYDHTVEVAGDARRLEQVVLNLMLNGVEAMNGTGTLTIRVFSRGERAVLEVHDTGAGIAAAEIDRVLLPFYSTKPSGTGLGLPLVARIVAAHQGRIQIESETGRGTCVRVELPLTAASPALRRVV